MEATKEKMEHYRRDHQTLIMKNREKKVRRGGGGSVCQPPPLSVQRQLEKQVQEDVREEQAQQEWRNRQALVSAEGEAREKKKDMETIIHQLVSYISRKHDQ